MGKCHFKLFIFYKVASVWMNKGHLAQSTVNGSLFPVVQTTTKLFLLWKCAAKVGYPSKGIETSR